MEVPAPVKTLMRYVFSLHPIHSKMQAVFQSIIIQDDKVISLDVSGIDISGLTRFFHLFKDLRFLSLNWCSLRELPRSVRKLEAIEELYLARNALSSLPEEFVELETLTLLDLSYNQFKYIPPLLTKMENLQFLSLKKNQIEKKDFPISKFKFLEGINLIGNPIKLHHKEQEFLDRRPFVISKSFHFSSYVERKLILNGEEFTLLSSTIDKI